MEYSDYIETRSAAVALTGNEKFAFSQGGIAVGDDLNAFATFINSLIDRYTFPFPQFTTATSTTAYTGTPSPVISAYATGQKFQVKIHATSTAAATLNLNSVGAKKIFINPTTQATTGDLLINQIYIFAYDAALDTAAGGFLMIGSGGGGGTPGGSTTQVQYNNVGAFAGITGATTDGTILSVTTATEETNTTQAASTAFVKNVIGGSDLFLYYNYY